MNVDEQTIFLTVLEFRTAAERVAWLDRSCASDGELRARIEALLKRHDAPVHES